MLYIKLTRYIDKILDRFNMAGCNGIGIIFDRAVLPNEQRKGNSLDFSSL